MKTLTLEQAIIKRLLEQEQEAPVSIQPNSIIYVDMDGVVVDFHTPMIGEINSILDSGLPDFLQGSKTSRRALRKIKQQMGEEYRVTKKIDLHNSLIRDLTFSIIKRKPYDYFVNLGQMKDGVKMLWPYVTSLPYRIEMLTASVQGLDPDKKTAEDAKKDWVATHLDPQPATVNVVMGAARKIPYATSNGVPNVLIDDRSDTIAKWNEAGGIGILHTTGNSASTIQRLKGSLSSKVLQEQISIKDVEDTLKDRKFWTYYLDQVEYVPLASAIAGPTNALLKFQKGDSIGAAASASSVIPFYKAIRALRGATSLGKQTIINLASEAGIDVTEDQVKDLLGREKIEKAEKNLLASMTDEEKKLALRDQYRGRDGMSAKEYGEEQDALELQDQMKGEAAKRKPRKKDVILEAVIRRLLNEQPYKTPGQEYIALFLDDASRDKLTDTLDDPPPGWTLYADHMTVKFGSEGVPERYLGPAQCKVVGVALNDRVMTARVETDIPAQNDIPHITIATAPGAKPSESNDFSLDDFDDVDAIVLKGEVRPKFREELQKKRPSI